ncbi:MAG: glycosyltransferase family 4 protein [Candidatus Krumholzibacteria bacterium]|nr:glycosyltransferase family 4 protein [Candidatus Krumholzibacteria bacterium]
MNGKLSRIAVLSIWEGMWSLGEGCGVPDEMHFINGLTARGVEIDYLIPEPADRRDPYTHEGLRYHHYPNIFRSYGRLPGPAKRFLVPGLFPRAVMPALRKLASERRPDLILGYTYYALGPIGVAAKEAGIPSVAKLFGVMYLNHLGMPKLKYWWYNYEQILAMRKRVDHYIVLNDGTQGRDALTRLGIPAQKISFLPNGMDKGWAGLDVDRAGTRASLGLPPDKTLLVTFSRLVGSKRVDLFLEAAALISPALLEGAAIVIGGDGPYRARLEARARELGLGDRTFFTGPLRYEEVPRFLKACDIFVGTNELTNMSMPPCEALLCGLPVVAFDVAGTSETVIDGRNGLLAPDNDLPALASKIETLLADRELRERLGRQAMASALENFMSWDERVSKEIELFERLSGGKYHP